MSSFKVRFERRDKCMPDSAAAWQSDLYGILPHSTEPRILLLHGDVGWALPHARVNEAVQGSAVGRVTPSMQKELGIDVTTLRCMSIRVDKDKRRQDGIFLLENHTPAWAPPAGRWVEREALAQLPLALPEHRAAIESCLTEIESGILPECRVPWARPAWFAEAASWIQTQLAQLGYTLTAPIEQVKSWCLSCILRAHTTTGDVYFKVAADLPLFVNEATVMQELAEQYPRHVPAPLRIDHERGWLLLPDFGRELGWDAPIAMREAALRAFGRLQIDTARRSDDLLAVGCLDRRLDRLADQIDPLLDSLDAPAGLAESEIAQLRALAPRLKAMCNRLASYRVPPTLVHGDMHMSNVIARDGDYQFFDWTDACVAHPFLDTIDILHEDDPAIRERLRDSYLALWADFEPMDRLLEMWAMAYPLCALHQAVSYQHIIANVEDAATQDFDWALPFWLGQVLATML